MRPRCCAGARRPPCSRPTTASTRCSSGSQPGLDRMVAARRLAADSGCTVLLKGPATVVADPDGDALVVTAGDARLATAGTGDVLSGIIGALAGRRRDAVACSCGSGVGARSGRSARSAPRTRRRRSARPDSGGAGRAAVSRWAWAEVDLDAVQHNVERLCSVAAPGGRVGGVKADGYGHGAVPVARAALARWRDRTVRRAGARRRGAARGRDRLPDPGAQRAAGDRAASTRCAPSSISPCTRMRSWRRSPPPAVAITRCTSRSTPGCAASGRRPTTRSALADGDRAVAGGAPGRGVHPPRGRRRAGRPVHRDAARAVRRRADGARRRRHRPAAGARRQLGGDARPSGSRTFGMVRAGIAIYGISPGAASTDLCAALRPALSLRSPRLAREAGARRRPDLVRPAASLRRRHHRRHAADRLRRRRAPAAVRRRRRGADRRASPPDRRRGHDGPADGRLRRRSEWPSATRRC